MDKKDHTRVVYHSTQDIGLIDDMKRHIGCKHNKYIIIGDGRNSHTFVDFDPEAPIKTLFNRMERTTKNLSFSMKKCN